MHIGEYILLLSPPCLDCLWYFPFLVQTEAKNAKDARRSHFKDLGTAPRFLSRIKPFLHGSSIQPNQYEFFSRHQQSGVSFDFHRWILVPLLIRVE